MHDTTVPAWTCEDREWIFFAVGCTNSSEQCGVQQPTKRWEITRLQLRPS
jgi:hypothetical protein